MNIYNLLDKTAQVGHHVCEEYTYLFRQIDIRNEHVEHVYYLFDKTAKSEPL